MTILRRTETASASAAAARRDRKLPIGAELLKAGTHFRVWAPKCHEVAVVSEGRRSDRFALEREAEGYFSGLVKDLEPGTRYRYRLDGREAYPDPASRFQPEGPHGPSMVVDPDSHQWRSTGWCGVPRGVQVIYEMHIGTFSPEGTWRGAIDALEALAELGVTVIEVMPVADFAGDFGWGYDGVNLFAPTRLYGSPEDMRAFIDAAHGLDIGVILDVVYNHFGPDGNYLRNFSDHYFSTRYSTDWGEAINFDDEGSPAVRAFFLANVRHWIAEYRLDGLRLDATQDIFDASPRHILAEIATAVREAAAGRSTLIVAENEPQQTRLVMPVADGGCDIDLLWNDDLHHSAMVRLTGKREAYYTDYRGTPQEFISAAKYGYLYQGQLYRWQKQRRGTATRGLKPSIFVNYIQNHDQIANSGHGQRVAALAGAAQNRAFAALLLLMPGTPMLFQGQEFAASSPFFYFACHKPEIAEAVAKGRAEFLAQFPSLATPEMQALIPDPCDAETFRRSKLDPEERARNAATVALHRDLIALRKHDPVLGRDEPQMVDGAVLSGDAFLLRYFAKDGMDRLLIVNFGSDQRLDAAPEPLIAPPRGCAWTLLWSSEDPHYGGSGTPPIETADGWMLPGHGAVVLKPVELAEPDKRDRTSFPSG
jgi:maltooligosyltrehalose trehalohydrolase